MNLAGHIAVAERVVPDDPRFWLGAALPDLAAMGRFRLLGRTDDERVTAGIAFHHRTDEAFHHHRWFVGLQAPLGDALLGHGVARGPARAIAHVGPELLLDGWILRTEGEATRRALDELDRVVDALDDLVAPEHRTRWRHHLDRVAGWRPHDDAHDADAVARRLHRILERRPRLAFPATHLGEVSGELARIVGPIDDTAAALVADLADRLRTA